jgi:type IV pilus assembly protein PilO
VNLDDLNNLDFNNMGSWPLPAKIVAIIVLCIAVLFAGYWFDTKSQIEVLESARAKENELKQKFETKQAVAANLDAYRKQMEEIEKTFGALLLQLPSKTEIAELLVDISRVGLDSGLEFELFKPQDEVRKEFYAEFPIQIRVNGTYHQFGNFASGVAALPRIVTMHNLSIVTQKGKDNKGRLVMNATANTYRYLDKDEMKEAARGKKKKKR